MILVVVAQTAFVPSCNGIYPVSKPYIPSDEQKCGRRDEKYRKWSCCRPLVRPVTSAIKYNKKIMFHFRIGLDNGEAHNLIRVCQITQKRNNSRSEDGPLRIRQGKECRSCDRAAREKGEAQSDEGGTFSSVFISGRELANSEAN